VPSSTGQPRTPSHERSDQFGEREWRAHFDQPDAIRLAQPSFFGVSTPHRYPRLVSPEELDRRVVLLTVILDANESRREVDV
jgi:hypothetical protein